MKRTKLIVILCMVMLAALSLALLAGCDTGGTQYNYDYLVTFDYNVARFGETTCETQYLGVKSGSKLVAPGGIKQGVFDQGVVDDYFIEGWYTAQVDAEGNPVKDEKGTVLLQDKWNFASDTVTSDMTLYANFVKYAEFRVVIDGVNDFVKTASPGQSISNLELFPQKDGWTFIDYYVDEGLTQKMTFPYVMTDQDFKCYAKMLEGNWAIVENTNNFLNALLNGRNMYFKATELDFSTRTLDPDNCLAWFGNNYNGKIIGNNCVIKNLDINMVCPQKQDIEYNYSIFGNIGANAEIDGITFQNVSLTVNVTMGRDNIKTAFFAAEIASGAKLTNLNFTGCTLTYTGTPTALLGLGATEENGYGYYVSCADSYTCFDKDQLTYRNNTSQQ